MAVTVGLGVGPDWFHAEPPAAAAGTAPFETAPQVRFETVNPPGPSRTAGRAHPARGVPDRLVVPTLGVDAPVVGIGVSGGVLLPPDDPRTLGWWRDGARPGDRRGASLITGHTVSSGGGAFDDLDTLEPGDRVKVRTARGVVPYEVTGVDIYRKASLARHAARLFSQEAPGRLVLVTCEDWNGSTYLSNAVVVAHAL